MISEAFNKSFSLLYICLYLMYFVSFLNNAILPLFSFQPAHNLVHTWFEMQLPIALCNKMNNGICKHLKTFTVIKPTALVTLFTYHAF